MKSIKCYGKINIVLRVGPRRADGFHELLTVYQTVSLFDVVSASVTPEKSIRVSCSDPSVSCGPDNLAWKAAAALRKAKGSAVGIRIHIQKGIPSGGGMGGGSADAAGTLMLLNRLMGSALSDSKLTTIAASLGSDIPFFLRGGTAIGTGRGEIVTPLPDIEPISFFAVFPGKSFLTRDMYRLLDESNATLQKTRLDPHYVTKPLPVRELLENTFDCVAGKMSVEVGDAMVRLRGKGHRVILSGSGSTFLVFSDKASVEALTGEIPEEWVVRKLESISRQEIENERLS